MGDKTEPIPRLIESIEDAREVLCPHGALAFLMNCAEIPHLEAEEAEEAEHHGHTFVKIDVTDVANSNDERMVGFTIIADVDDEDEDVHENLESAKRCFTAAWN